MSTDRDAPEPEGPEASSDPRAITTKHDARYRLKPSLTPDEMRDQFESIRQLISQGTLVDGEDFGTFMESQAKPALLKPGAEKLGLFFGLAGAYKFERHDYGDGHREYECDCRLTDRATKTFVGEGSACCSTREAKYRYRRADPVPTDRPVPKAYWDALKRDYVAAKGLLGGNEFCAVKVDDAGKIVKDRSLPGRWVIARTSGERVEHDNPADYYNTVKRIARKRAYIDAILTCTAASSLFVHDDGDDSESGETPKSRSGPAAAPPRRASFDPAAVKASQGIPGAADRTPDGRPIIAFESDTLQTKECSNGNVRYSCKSNGEWYATFDERCGAIMQEACRTGEVVVCEWTPTKYGNDITYLELLSRYAPPTEQSPLENPDAIPF